MLKRFAALPLALSASSLIVLNACAPAGTPNNVAPGKTGSTTPSSQPGTTPSATSPSSNPPGSTDLGFRSQPDGFQFENGSAKPFKLKEAGTDYLTIKGMQQMFGDKNVCTGSTSGDKCVPTPQAKKWHDKINHAMNNGQCEGMAVLALSLYKGVEKAAELEAGKNSTYSLDYGSKVREQIGLYFAYQYTDKVLNGTVRGTPKDVLAKLGDYLKPGAQDPVTLGFYGETGGHATTPYAISDEGNGLFHIKMYDNNWPGQERFIEVDTKANTWIYNFAATNPTEDAGAWKGDAKSLSLEFTPLSTRLNVATCPYCNKGSDSSSSRQIYLNAGKSGKAHLRVVDKNDPSKFVGWDAATKQYVNHLDGAMIVGDKSVVKKDDAIEAPMISVPEGMDYQVLVDGDEMTGTEPVKLSVFGQGKSLEISNIRLDPHQRDTISLGADGDSLKYKPGNSQDKESPIIKLGYDDPNGRDYAFEIKNLDAVNGEELSTDFDNGKLEISDSEGETDPYDLVMERFNDDGSQATFSKDHIPLTAGEMADIDFSDWEGEGQSMLIGPAGHEVAVPDVDGDDDSDSEPDDEED